MFEGDAQNLLDRVSLEDQAFHFHAGFAHVQRVESRTRFLLPCPGRDRDDRSAHLDPRRRRSEDVEQDETIPGTVAQLPGNHERPPCRLGKVRGEQDCFRG